MQLFEFLWDIIKLVLQIALLFLVFGLAYIVFFYVPEEKVDIKETEFYLAHKQHINSLSENQEWNGVFSDLKEEKGSLLKIDDRWTILLRISFLLQIESITDSTNIFLKCVHTYPERDAENDVLFNTITNIPENSEVIVSGALSRDRKEEVAFEYDKNQNRFLVNVKLTNIEISQ